MCGFAQVLIATSFARQATQAALQFQMQCADSHQVLISAYASDTLHHAQRKLEPEFFSTFEFQLIGIYFFN